MLIVNYTLCTPPVATGMYIYYRNTIAFNSILKISRYNTINIPVIFFRGKRLITILGGISYILSSDGNIIKGYNYNTGWYSAFNIALNASIFQLCRCLTRYIIVNGIIFEFTVVRVEDPISLNYIGYGVRNFNA